MGTAKYCKVKCCEGVRSKGGKSRAERKEVHLKVEGKGGYKGDRCVEVQLTKQWALALIVSYTLEFRR